MDLIQYYGADWLAMTLTIAAIYMLGSKKQNGFLVMTAGNAVWIVFGILAASVATIAANGVFAALNIRGYLKWSHDSKVNSNDS